MLFSMENGPTFKEIELALMRIPDELKAPEWKKKMKLIFKKKQRLKNKSINKKCQKLMKKIYLSTMKSELHKLK